MSIGLSQREAEVRLKEFGRNEVVPSSMETGLAHFLKFLKDPMGLMMLSLSLVYYLLGEMRDALILLIAFIPVSAMDVFLEVRAERALRALKSTFQPMAKVFRDGVLQTISIQEIVPGDWIALEEGQTIPADGIIQSAAHLSVSEAALTGESLPIEKSPQQEIYAGTTILTGRGTYTVSQTGRTTKFGKIVDLLEEAHEVKSPLQLKVQRLVRQILKVAFILVIVLFALELIRGKTTLESLLISLTFGMASVPEEFPLVFTLYLSLGAWRLSKRGVLVKSLPSVETLGSVDVICTDKTGTLTEGKFQLNEIIPFHPMSQEKLWQFAMLACEPEVVDSMELAIKEKKPLSLNLDHWKLVHDYPFETEGKHMSHAWKHADGSTLVAMKGAVEGVLEHCGDTPDLKQRVLRQTEILSSQGYRILGLAGKRSSITGQREKDENDLQFMGIMTFSDPIRESAKRAIEICQTENIMVKMMTGDHPFTAHAIADQLGLIHSHEELYTGSDLRALATPDRISAYRKGAIFSRVTPEQKYELIQVLKNDGKIVAMTGDGINDTPAMKIADIGISMGATATDAARATAKMILTQSDFNGIVFAIMEGRKIFSNLRKSFAYLISFHVPIVLLALLPPLLNLGELLLPIQIILLELIVHPVSAFTFENYEGVKGLRNRGLIDGKMALSSLFAGVMLSLLALLPFWILPESTTYEEKRTVAFTTVLFGNMGFVLLETWPVFMRRLWITLALLLIVTLSTFSVSAIAHQLRLANIGEQWLVYSLICGLCASFPSWIIRRNFRDH